MDFLKDIEEEVLCIVPNILKEKVLREIDRLKKLVNVKILSFSNLKRELYFDYDESAILYLMSKYHYKYEVAKNYIDYMYYLEDKVYQSDKLRMLLNLKMELMENQLLTVSNDFINYYKDKKVIVFGYDYINQFNKKMLGYFHNVSQISKTKYDKICEVYPFSTLEEEIVFVIHRIVELIQSGVLLENIFIVNSQEEYTNEIIKLFKMYHIPINLERSSSISTTLFVKDVMNVLKDTQSFVLTIEYMKEKYDFTSESISQLYFKLLNIFNKYSTIDVEFPFIFEAVEYDIKNTFVEPKKQKNSISVSTLINNFYCDSEYVFLIGFNQGLVPLIHKDEDFISDNLKEEVGLESTSLLNSIEKNMTIDSIASIKNIIISYKLHHMDSDFYPSDLLSHPMFAQISYKKDSFISYSSEYCKIKLAEMLDDLIKYDKTNDLLPVYFHSLDIPYMEFDNRFKGIDIASFYDFIHHRLVLSYTSIDAFYKCQFKYYLDYILNINKYEENFNTFIGSLFHFVLSRLYQESFDLDKDYEYYLKDRTFSAKEMFFLNKLKKELKIICDRLKEFNLMTGLTHVFTEKNISIDKSGDISVIFKGIIDKIMYKDFDGKTLVSVIDYKTGFTDIDLCNVAYGMSMQLVVYLYLITKSNLFENYSFVGFYLQRILSGEVNIEPGKSYIEMKNHNLRLYGYSTTDTLSLQRFDSTYENSEFIMGMKYGKNGFYRYSKVLSSEQMDQLVDLVDEKIDDAKEAILKGEFTINPKKLSSDKEITGCKFCKYKDICFRKNEDIVYLKKYTDLSFLSKEGEDYA